MNWNSKTTLLLVFLSIISAIFLLSYTLNKGSKKNFNDLALGDKTTNVFEVLDKKQINYQDFRVDANAAPLLTRNGKDFILSFGNSQSHSINSYQSNNDHLFIHYLDKDFSDYNVLNLSAPNANFQEMFLSLVNVEKIFTKKIKTVFFSAVFDDTREDGIRSKMTSLIHDNKEILAEYQSGKLMLESMQEDKEENKNPSDALLKYKAENALNEFVEDHLEVYARRGKIKGQLDTQIYYFRNWIFGIKPTTKRKKIAASYSRNLTALKDIKKFCADHNIELFFYIAPLRNDMEIPYVKSEYDAFKKDVSRIHTTPITWKALCLVSIGVKLTVTGWTLCTLKVKGIFYWPKS